MFIFRSGDRFCDGYSASQLCKIHSPNFTGVTEIKMKAEVGDGRCPSKGVGSKGVGSKERGH